MSECISRHGEYSSHVWDDAGLDCARCGYETSAREWLERHPHIAYPADVARARERALEAARKVMKHRYDVFTSHAALLDELFSALADLDAAEGGAS